MCAGCFLSHVNANTGSHEKDNKISAGRQITLANEMRSELRCVCVRVRITQITAVMV